MSTTRKDVILSGSTLAILEAANNILAHASNGMLRFRCVTISFEDPEMFSKQIVTARGQTKTATGCLSAEIKILLYMDFSRKEEWCLASPCIITVYVNDIEVVFTMEANIFTYYSKNDESHHERFCEYLKLPMPQ